MDEFQKATSAGGVIVKLFNGEPKVLVLVTKDEKKGFLPKGHVEGDETLEEAAFREVYEEAGLKKLKIITNLGDYQRRVDKEGVKEDKTIHYFLMIPTTKDEKHNPLEDTRNIDFNWYPLNNLPEMYLEENRHVIDHNQELIRKLINKRDH